MIKCEDIMNFMDGIAPRELAEEWDNVGLLLGNRNNEVKNILLCMDVTAASAKYAVDNGSDMIISHHPLIFKKLGRLVENDAKGNVIYTLIRNDISVFVAHTNLDFAKSGVNDCLAATLGIGDAETYGNGPGKVGILQNEMKLTDFIEKVKSALDTKKVRVIGDSERVIKRAAVFSGSFDGDLDAVKNANADVLVTGDIKYHTALDACAEDLCIIDAGHFNTEKIVLPSLAERLRENFEGIDIMLFTDEEDPFKTY